MAQDDIGFNECEDRGNERLYDYCWSAAASQSYGSRQYPADQTIAAYLRNKLKEAAIPRIDLPGLPEFVPNDAIERIINENSIYWLLRETQDGYSADEHIRLARIICYGQGPSTKFGFRKVAATLIRSHTEDDLVRFVHAGFGDHCLPMVQAATGNNGDIVQHPRADTIHSLTHLWNLKTRKKFCRLSETFNAPFFTKLPNGIYHYVLGKSTVLPYEIFDTKVKSDTSLDDHDNIGGYGEVNFVRLHPSHNYFGNFKAPSRTHLFAVKRLNTRTYAVFREEVDALLRVANCGSRQLLELLATYEIRGSRGSEFHLVFPRAESNVRELWEQMSTAERRTDRCTLWIARESAKIAEALCFLHSRHISSVGEDKNGRHGDLKAENFLIFKDPYDPLRIGSIYLSDFGLSSFHRHESRSKVQPRATSPSYRPPEFDLPRGTLSRKSDIWSLGTFYLEFITQRLEGRESLAHFPDDRIAWDDLNKVDSDIFFEIVPGNPPKAILKPVVKRWAERLHSNPDCSQFLHEFLDLVIYHMLLPDRDSRITAQELSHELQRMRQECERVPSYYTVHCPCAHSA